MVKTAMQLSATFLRSRPGSPANEEAGIGIDSSCWQQEGSYRVV